jgi:uncharacterized repeat protein (TIGR03803 family)
MTMRARRRIASNPMHHRPRFRHSHPETPMTPDRRIPRTLCALAAALACNLACAASHYVVEPIDPATQGQRPGGQLLAGADGTLYGTAQAGGPDGDGTVFRVDTRGRIKVMHAFDGTDGFSASTGLTPGADGWMYGATELGGANGLGGLFRINVDGRFEPLHDFDDGADHGAQDVASPMVFGADGNLYGTTVLSSGYPERNGTVFRLTPQGALQILYVFGTQARNPVAGVAFGPDGRLYGATMSDGRDDCGVLYSLATDGSDFRLLHRFSAGVDGCQPRATLVFGEDGGLYGTTPFGGPVGGVGTIFRFDLSTQAVSVLHTFHDDDPLGSNPMPGLSRDAAGTLYGATVSGSTNGLGAVFSLTTGGKLRLQHAFAADGVDGMTPWAPPTPLPGGRLAGTTVGGGALGAGTIWHIDRTHTP